MGISYGGSLSRSLIDWKSCIQGPFKRLQVGSSWNLLRALCIGLAEQHGLEWGKIFSKRLFLKFIQNSKSWCYLPISLDVTLLAILPKFCWFLIGSTTPLENIETGTSFFGISMAFFLQKNVKQCWEISIKVAGMRS